MEWAVEPDSKAGERRYVAVPDELVEAFLATLDVPFGSFALDPYRDYTFQPSQVATALARAEQAIDEMRSAHREAALKKLRLREWQPWAEGLLGSLESEDPLLGVLQAFRKLCELSLHSNRPMEMYGQ